MAKKKEEIYEYINGIKCKIKNPKKKYVVKFYQESLQKELDKYISINRMTEKRQGYADGLAINIAIAPFVLGWLKKPEDPDEYLVVKGKMTVDELEKKIKKSTTKRAAPKKTAPKKNKKKKN